jgi:hypothetical protein
MGLIGRIFSFIAIFNLVVTPAFALNLSAEDSAKLAGYRDFLEPMGYRISFDEVNNKALVYDKNSNTLAMEIPFASQENLQKFSPKSLNRMMLDEMSRVKASSKAAWSHSVSNLPAESALFFMAMGAVVAGQLISNYSQNPIAMKQHIDHSLSPIGIFGFFTFMYSQGVTSNILSLYMTNPRFHHMIPYLGMTVGAFLQTYLSQISSDPNVKVCAKTMIGGGITDSDRAAGVDNDPCSKAYEYLILRKKLWEYAPGLVSMLISSGLAGFAQSMVTRAVLRVTGVDIALWLVPGTMQIKGIRLVLVKGLQIGVFTALDLWLNRKVTYLWKNFFDGSEFNASEEKIVTQMNVLKSRQWSSSDDELQKELIGFHKKMSAWRMMNLSETYEAHANWSESLRQLTSMYSSSQFFYGNVIREIRNSRFKLNELPYLERNYPYYGVPALGLSSDRKDIYYTNPQFIESMQEEKIANAVSLGENLLNGEKGRALFPGQKKIIQKILNGLKSNNRDQKGLALRELLMTIQSNKQSIGFMDLFNDVLTNIYKSLGNPDPLLEPGRGFLYTMENSSEGEVLKGSQFYRSVGAFQTPKVSDYLIMQMLCGPDVETNQKSVRNSLGFPSVFLPPTIRAPEDDLIACQSMGTAQLDSSMIYKFKMRDKMKNNYNGAIDYLIIRARPSVVGTSNQAKFEQWWRSKTETQMKSAFEKFSREYEKMVAKMVERVYLDGRNVINAGPISNGTMNAAFQEIRVYLSLLEELYKPGERFSLHLVNILDSSRAPKTQSLRRLEHEFQTLNGLLKQIKIVEVENETRIHSPLENYQLEEQLSKIQEALKIASIQLGVGDTTSGSILNLNPKQKKLAILCFENLQTIASEIMMYGTIANAVSWDKIQNLKKLNIEEQRFENSIQAKLAAMRGLTMQKN